jgi:regulator of sigma E protease
MISPIPLGGYVKLLGENKEEEIEDSLKKFSFQNKSAFQKILIVAGGPLFNFIFAALVFGILFIKGVPILQPYVGEVQKNFPAQKAGIKKGDKILSINGIEINSWDKLSKIVMSSKGNILNITVLRQKKVLQFKLKPKTKKIKNIFGEEKERYFIGIIADTNKFVIKHYNPIEAIIKGFSETYKWIKLTILSIVKIFERVIPLKTLGGPILIGKIAGEQAKEGIGNFLFFLAVISVNLGVLNLFPIPILDGGHIVIITIESLLRREIDIKKLEFIQKLGLSFLILLMGIAFYNDILRLLSGG